MKPPDIHESWDCKDPCQDWLREEVVVSGAPGKALCLPNYLWHPLVCAWHRLMVNTAFHSIMRLKVQRPLEKRTQWPTFIFKRKWLMTDWFSPETSFHTVKGSEQLKIMERKRGQQALMRPGRSEEMGNRGHWSKCHLFYQVLLPEPARREEGCRGKK